MKVPIISSLLIIAVTAVLAFLQENRMDGLEEEQTNLENEATALGIPLDGSPASKSDVAAAESRAVGASHGGGTRSGEGAVPSGPGQVAEEFAQELIALAKRIKAREARGEEMSREEKVALFTFLDRFLSLDPEVIPFLMAEIRAYDGLEDDDKRNILRFAMMSMAQTDPEKALELFLNSGDLMGEDRGSDGAVKMALGSWAAEDPEAALAWLAEHGEDVPDRAAREVRTFAIAQAFKIAPARAVALALDLEREQVLQLAEHLGRLGQSPQEQLDLLRRVQDQLGELPGDPDTITDEFVKTAGKDQLLRGALLMGLGGVLSAQSFDSTRDFLASADLDATEQFVVAAGIAEHGGELQDPGAWLPWLHDHIPEARRDDTISNLLKDWTRRDFQATAAWIGDLPPGDLRTRATYSFAETVAAHEPASAADWALTLPASEERTELLENIHEQWARKDEEAAAEFARQNGLEE